MSKTAANALRELAERKSGGRSKIGRVREVFAEIEHAQMSGVELKEILSTLNGLGFEIKSLASFNDMLHRIRAEKQLTGKGKRARAVALQSGGDGEHAAQNLGHPLRRSTDKQLPVGAGPEAGTPAANPAGGELPPSPQSPSDAVKPAKPPAPKKARGGNTRQESLSAEDLKKLSRGSPDLSAFEDDTD